MPLHGQNIIGYSLAADGANTFQAVNPATGEMLETHFHHATQAEVDRALALANAAFRGAPRPDAAQTAALLDRIAQEIESLGDELIERGVAETALPATRLQTERGRTTGQLRMFAALVREGSWVDARIDRGNPARRPTAKPDMRLMLKPIGPVVVFGASNFPLAFSTGGGDTASALAAGCPVIVKARPSHPGTAELVGQAIQKAIVATGMSDGWFSMLHGSGRELGTYLVRHPVVQAVGFTGSLQGGRALCEIAAARPSPIPVFAEMGSVNPVFLLPEAVRQRGESIAEALYQAVTMGVGQFCTNPGLIIAQEGDELDRFLKALASRIERHSPASMLLQSILTEYEAGIERLIRTAEVSCVARSRESADRRKTQCRAAVFVVDADAFVANPGLHHEVFGPVTLVVRYRRRQQLLDVVDCLGGQLASAVHAAEGELAQYQDLLAAMERKAGRLVFNAFPPGMEVCSATHHGGPFPAASDVHYTSLGTAAIYRFARPVCYQDFPESALPPELRDRNQRGIWRLIDNVLTKDDIGDLLLKRD
jgi:2,5-dioxopentanoate dehydrogenase